MTGPAGCMKVLTKASSHPIRHARESNLEDCKRVVLETKSSQSLLHKIMFLGTLAIHPDERVSKLLKATNLLLGRYFYRHILH